jgi:branched-chain amino acid transport system permease protein
MKTMPAVGFANFATTLLIAAIVGGLVGFVVSYATLRLKQEWYLALVLLVGGEIVRIVVRGMDDLICSHNGISGIAQPFAFVGDARTASILFMIMVLGLACIAAIYSGKLIHSPYGRMLKAMRENESVTRSLGKRVAMARAQIMLIGSVIAAVSGVLFAVNLGFVNTNDYVVTLTLDVWVMIVLGGLGNNRAALLGALLITVLDRATAIAAIQLNMSGITLEFNYIRFILFGTILLLMLRYRPQGLLPESPITTAAHIALHPETVREGK